MTRAVAWCNNEKCPQGPDHMWVYRLRILVNADNAWRCDGCYRMGVVEPERNVTHGDGLHFREVRINFMWTVQAPGKAGEYKATAIVRDETLRGKGSVYELWSPIMRSEKRALATAELLLGNLNRRPDLAQHGRELARFTEPVLDLCLPRAEYNAQLEEIARDWSPS